MIYAADRRPAAFWPRLLVEVFYSANPGCSSTQQIRNLARPSADRKFRFKTDACKPLHLIRSTASLSTGGIPRSKKRAMTSPPPPPRQAPRELRNMPCGAAVPHRVRENMHGANSGPSSTGAGCHSQFECETSPARGDAGDDGPGISADSS
jgi:hypothetical protein